MTKKGKQGAEEINQLMRKMRQESPKTIANKVVTRLDDFQLGHSKNADGSVKKLDFPKANVLKFHLEDGSTVAVRPSGTEPKIKFYISVNGILNNTEDYANLQLSLNNTCKELMSVITNL